MGIGTAAPRRLLDVQGGDIIASGNIGVGTTNPIHSLHVGRQAFFNSNVGIGTTVPRQLLDVQGGNAIVSGNVGVGTTAIQAKMDVYGSLNCRDMSINFKSMYHFHVSSIAYGYGTDQDRGVWMNGSNVAQSGRSWHMLVVSGSGANKGNILVNATYDVYGVPSLATSFVTDLSTYNVNNNVIVIHTFDEPNNNADPIRTALQN